MKLEFAVIVLGKSVTKPKTLQEACARLSKEVAALGDRDFGRLVAVSTVGELSKMLGTSGAVLEGKRIIDCSPISEKTSQVLITVASCYVEIRSGTKPLAALTLGEAEMLVIAQTDELDTARLCT